MANPYSALQRWPSPAPSRRADNPFRGVETAILLVDASTVINFARRKGPLTQAQRRGLLYERRAQGHLSLLYGPEYLPSPWFRWTAVDDPRPRYCQPDGLILRPDRIVIVEIKNSFSPEAFDKLDNFYLPIVLAASRQGAFLPIVTSWISAAAQPPGADEEADDGWVGEAGGNGATGFFPSAATVGRRGRITTVTTVQVTPYLALDTKTVIVTEPHEAQPGQHNVYLLSSRRT